VDHCMASQKLWNKLQNEFSHDAVYASVLEV
jgi:hypothetical protein